MGDANQEQDSSEGQMRTGSEPSSRNSSGSSETSIDRSGHKDDGQDRDAADSEIAPLVQTSASPRAEAQGSARGVKAARLELKEAVDVPRSEQDAREARKLFRGAAVMSFSFSLVESCYVAALALLVPILGESVGGYASGALYISFALFQFAGPAICKKIGVKRALVGGLSSWAAFLAVLMASNIAPANTFDGWLIHPLIPAAAISGFGAAVAWNGQGVYITRSAVTYATKFREVGDADNAADENGTATGTSDGVEQRAIGTFNGLFNGIFQAGLICGGLLTALILNPGHLPWAFDAAGDPASQQSLRTLLFSLLFVLAACGVASMAFLVPSLTEDRNMQAGSGSAPSATEEEMSLLGSSGGIAEAETPHAQRGPSAVARVKVGFRAALSSVWRNATIRLLLEERKLQLLIPYNAAFGLVNALFGFYVNSKIVADLHGEGAVGAFGVVMQVTALVMAAPLTRLSNLPSLGRKLVMSLGSVAYTVLLVLLLTLTNGPAFESSFLVGFIFFLCGFGNCVWQGCCAAVHSDFFTNNPAPAFANLKLWSGLASAFAFFVFPSLEDAVLVPMCLSVVLLGLVCYLQADRLASASLAADGAARETSG